MLTVLSVITGIKDYVEIVHKLVETDSSNFNSELILNGYFNFGSILTYIVLCMKTFISDLLSFHWLQSISSLPVIVPTIASCMISEISVLDGYFHNALSFLETPLSYGNSNLIFYCLEKFTIGLINSLFLFLPTSTAHFICLRRFVMQGLEAGYLAGLGTIAGNMVWIGSLVFGLRFLIIPWLSFDIFRYVLGFILLVKYMWDSYSEKRVVLEDLSKKKIFLLNFLLAFTEQTNIYPFVNHLSIGSDSTLLESFPTTTSVEFFAIHSCYLLGIFLGSFSLLQVTCWFLENPAFRLYMWMISSFKITTGMYSKMLNFVFLYLTMLCTINSISYFALDYCITNPLGFVYEDRILDQKKNETSFLNTKASDRNTRRNRGRHGRRERWKRRVRKYRTFDASLYDQGIYDLFTIEDLNYGFDRFWLRRKIRNHRVHFRFFPGPWMRSFKKQLSRPRLESFMGPRVEFFRILFEQVYHPEFHEFSVHDKRKEKETLSKKSLKNSYYDSIISTNLNSIYTESIYSANQKKLEKQGFIKEYSALRKCIRKMHNRINSSMVNSKKVSSNMQSMIQPIYSKRWKSLFSKISHQTIDAKLRQQQSVFQHLYKTILVEKGIKNSSSFFHKEESERRNSLENLSKKERAINRYKSFLNDSSFITLSQKNIPKNEKEFPKIEMLSSMTASQSAMVMTNANAFSNSLTQRESNSIEHSIQSKKRQTNKNTESLRPENEIYKPLTLFHPLEFYLKREQAFQRKFKMYGANIYRHFGIENNASYFRTMMRRFFYYYKPTLRWERTLHTATMRKARRKGSRKVLKQNLDKTTKAVSIYGDGNLEKLNHDNTSFMASINALMNTNADFNDQKIQKPTHFYSLIGKRASRYRYQIYKDVLQHWYYSPFNRFLLKLDVDNFIRRQPNSYFLTKKEEQLLHLRRFLLSEYYQTLRWYTYMQHYSSMKHRIGGTKSFASRMYSQQFMGTFKKVRHLFALTPSFSENTMLKFDQSLYNEIPNSPKSLYIDSLVHEELLADDNVFISNKQIKKPKNAFILGEDLISQSTKVIREYFIKATPIRQRYIKNLLEEENYWEFTKFILKGQKLRGTHALTNEHRFLMQEKNHLLTFTEKEELSKSNLKFQETTKKMIENLFNKKTTMLNDSVTLSERIKNVNVLSVQRTKGQQFIKEENKQEKQKTDFNKSVFVELQQNLWIELFKKCHSTLYDQESLKYDLLHHVDKRKKQQKRQEKYLKNRLERFQNWFLDASKNPNKQQKSTLTNLESLNGIPTAIQKGIKEGILSINHESPSFYKFPIRKTKSLDFSKSKSNRLKNHLFNRIKTKQLQVFDIEGEIKKSLNFYDNGTINIQKETNMSIIDKTIIPFKYLYKIAKNQPLSFIQSFFSRFLPTNLDSSSKAFSFSDSELNSWRKKEMALTKRKKTRKTLKRLRNTNQRSIQSNPNFSYKMSEFLKYQNQKGSDVLRNQDSFPLRQKSDFYNSENQKRIESWKGWINRSNSMVVQKTEQPFMETFKQMTSKKWKRKRSRLRRYRRLRSRGPIKKRTLGEKLKRQFKLLKRYSRSSDIKEKTNDLNRFDKKVEIFQMITKRKYEPKSVFLMRETKQRRTRLIKRRFWRKHKKPKYSQNKRKLRKRRRYAVGKIRNLFKEYKRIQGNIEVKQWWWEQFLPNLRASLDIHKILETDNKLQMQFSKFSNAEILERDLNKYKYTNQSNSSGFEQETNLAEKDLQIGDKDYKPLSIPQALRIHKDLESFQFLNPNNKVLTLEKLEENHSYIPENSQNRSTPTPVLGENNLSKAFNDSNACLLDSCTAIGKMTKNTFIKEPLFKLQTLGIQDEQTISSSTHYPFIVDTNPIPFYAGWDESLRKCVLTNRFLSIENVQNSQHLFYKDSVNPKNDSSPLKGMNAATTLYWQIPFTTYDPDQFFALGMDGFSPIGWRKFHFRYAKQTTKPILVKTIGFTSHSNLDSTNQTSAFLTTNALNHFSLSSNLQHKIQNSINQLFPKADRFFATESNKNNITSFKTLTKNQLRRSQKRYKRVKKHPRPPVWFPSGPLTNQVLPVHYIYVFYKRSRLPRDRYLRRRLRKISEPKSLSIQSSFTKYIDITLRKRVKPRRKYHRKRLPPSIVQSMIQRRAFRDQPEQGDRSRPIPLNFVNLQTEQSRLYAKKRKNRSKKSTENVRIRQLRRRVLRQVIRPVWRYRPKAGGYTWPGDYLRLEQIKAPLLGTSISSGLQETKSSSKSRKTRKKKRKMIQEWQIQPKKYLRQKHNLKVLKNRLEKSQNSHKMFQRSKNLIYDLQQS